MDTPIVPDGTGTPAPDGTPAGQNVAPAWIAQLPDDLKGNEAFTGYKTIGDLAKDALSFKEKATTLEGKLTTDYIPKLTENATDEQKAAYKAAMGIPDKAEDYEIPVPEGDTPELANELRQAAFTKGWPKGVVKELTEWWNGLQAKAVEKYNAELKTRTEEVKTKWGADFPKNAEIVKNVFGHFKDKGIDQLAMIEVKGPDGKPMFLGNHPVIQEFFLEFGKAMLPDAGLRGGPAAAKPAGNPTGFTYD
jgi:hypothetical protein